MPNRKQSQQSKTSATPVLQPRPSTSGAKHEQLIKELAQSKLFHEYLAGMIMHCMESIQSKIQDLSERIADLEELFSSQEKSFNELKSTLNEFKSISTKPTSDTNIGMESYLLRITGLNVENDDICQHFCNIVSDKLFLACDASKLSAVHPQSPSTTREAAQFHTIQIKDHRLYNGIIKNRTLLKGTKLEFLIDINNNLIISLHCDENFNMLYQCHTCMYYLSIYYSSP